MTDVLAQEFCPYKGLQPYTEEDRVFFFGRGRDTEIIASNLYAAPLTVLYGESGVGKSSVLLAGVVPLLRQTPNVAVVVFRQWQDPNVAFMLKSEIVLAIKDATGKENTVDFALPLDEFLLASNRILRGPIFMIFDQFEEFFMYNPPNESGAEGFDAEWARAVNRHEVDANFLLSLREDGLSRLDRFRGRIPKLLVNMLRLKHLNDEDGRDAIRKPLEKYNELVGDARPRVSIEPALVETLITELQAGRVTLGAGRGQVSSSQQQPPGAEREAEEERIETPFLQMVLTRLWDEERAGGSNLLRLATLERLGGAERIIRTHLDKVMKEKLSDAEQDVAARLFRFLVTPSGTKIAHTTLDLSAYAELPESQVEPVLKMLGAPDVRILRPIAPPPGQDDGFRYEIFHDVLAQAILDWHTRYIHEKKRVEEERERAKEREEAQLKLAVAQRRTRRLRRLTGISILFLIIAGWFLVIFYKQRGELRKMRADAYGMGVDAYARELSAYSYAELNRDPDLSLLLAIEAARVNNNSEHAAEALRGALAMQRTKLVLKPYAGAVRAVAFSPDGRYIATAHWRKVARIWDAGTGAEVSVLEGHEAEVMSVAFSRDGQLIVTAGWDKKVRVWENWQTRSPRIIETLTEPDALWSASFSGDGRYLLVSGDNLLKIWEWRTPEGPRERKNLSPAQRRSIFSAVFSPDGRYVATIGNNSTEVAIWEWEKDESTQPGAENPIRLETPGKIYELEFSDNGKYLAAACGDRAGRVWNWGDPAARRTPVLLTQSGAAVVRGIGISHDSSLVATTSEDGVVRLWEWQNPAELAHPLELRGHMGYVFSAAFSSSDLLVTGGEDNTARVWRTQGIDLDELPRDVQQLLRMALERRPRSLTDEERERYLDEDHEKFIQEQAGK